MVSPSLWKDPRRPLAALVLAGYAGVSFAAHDLYPFSRFDMYSHARASASRVVARDAHGDLAEVERFDGWQCDGPVDVSPGRCGEPGSYFYVGYIDDSRADYIARHAAAEGPRESVEVVRRIWWLDGPGAPRATDCPLRRCSAVRR
jgi:hypothetical protein